MDNIQSASWHARITVFKGRLKDPDSNCMEPYIIGSHQTSILYMVIVGQFEIRNS